jgi:hypothetical protein
MRAVVAAPQDGALTATMIIAFLAPRPIDRVREVAPPRPDVDVACLFLLASRDFDSAREWSKRKRECRPVWPGLHRDGAAVGMRDASDDR